MNVLTQIMFISAAASTSLAQMSTGEVKSFKQADPIQLCDNNQPNLTISHEDTTVYGELITDSQGTNYLEIDLHDAYGTQWGEGWFETYNAHTHFISLTDTQYMTTNEIEMTFDDQNEQVVLRNVVVNSEGTASPVQTYTLTYAELSGILLNTTYSYCVAANAPVTGSGTTSQEDGGITIVVVGSAIVATVAYIAKAAACQNDVNTAADFGRMACNGDPTCLCCVSNLQDDDLTNCLALNGPDGDYNNCVGVTDCEDDDNGGGGPVNNDWQNSTWWITR